MTVSSGLSASRTMRLALKELREILRDRRTIMTLILMPLLMYPLLGVIVKRGLISSLVSVDDTLFRLAVETDDEAKQVSLHLAAGALLLPQESAAGAKTSLVSELPAVSDRNKPAVKFFVLSAASSLEAELRSGHADIGIRVVRSANSERSFCWTLLHRTDSQLSVDARSYILKRLRALNDYYIKDTLKQHQIDVHLPADITEQTVESQSGQQSPLITFIPLVLVLMTMTGAVYPAIDLTAGERERGTMEILISSPVSRMTLLGGKFVAVLAVAMLTASVNMVSMFATLFTLGLDGAVLGESARRTIPLVMLMMLVFAGFFSAVLLSITSIARSFKEAQAYLIPLMLISLTPGMFSLMPDLQMGMFLAVTPLVNIVLTGRDLLHGNFNLLLFTIVILSTACYGVFALAVAARIFGSDSVLYGGSGSWTGLISRKDSPRPEVVPSTAVLALAIVFPLFIVVGNIPGRIGQTFSLGLPSVLLMNICVFLTVFVAVPVVVARLSNVSLIRGLSLRPRFPLISCLAAILFGLSMWAILFELNLFVGIASRTESLRRMLETLVEDLEKTPLSVKLASLALAPAVCEELFFRGFLQNSLRSRYSAATAITASALLFGLFHIMVRDSLFIERMIPSSIMGVILGAMLERSGSVFPGMLLHTIHNGLLLCVAHYKTQLEHLGIGLEQRSHLPPEWLAATVFMAVVAAYLLWRTKPVEQCSALSGIGESVE
ncbi:MAG: ABC transporter permease subunit [Fuerstiella sp.]|nr:ABC transporter permease subunit [Fuerstiella sp.]